MTDCPFSPSLLYWSFIHRALGCVTDFMGILPFTACVKAGSYSDSGHHFCTLRENSKIMMHDTIPSLNDFITVRCSVSSLLSLCLKQKYAIPVTTELEQLFKDAT